MEYYKEDTVRLSSNMADASWSDAHSRWRDGTVALLAGCVPDLGLHRLAIHLDAACGKLNPDGALALQVELVSGEAGQQVTLSNTRVTDKDNWNTEKRLLKAACMNNASWNRLMDIKTLSDCFSSAPPDLRLQQAATYITALFLP